MLPSCWTSFDEPKAAVKCKESLSEWLILRAWTEMLSNLLWTWTPTMKWEPEGALNYTCGRKPLPPSDVWVHSTSKFKTKLVVEKKNSKCLALWIQCSLEARQCGTNPSFFWSRRNTRLSFYFPHWQGLWGGTFMAWMHRSQARTRGHPAFSTPGLLQKWKRGSKLSASLRHTGSSRVVLSHTLKTLRCIITKKIS